MTNKALYLLEARNGSAAMVVRAACPTCARSVAVKHAGTEGTAVWRDPERSTCQQIRETGQSGLILRSDTQ